MAKVSVIVAASSPDLQASGIAAAVTAHDDMTLVAARVLSVDEIPRALDSVPRSKSCALVLVRRHAAIHDDESRWLMDRPRLVVLYVNVGDDITRISLRDPDLETVLDSLRDLAERASRSLQERVSHLRLRPVAAAGGRRGRQKREA